MEEVGFIAPSKTNPQMSEIVFVDGCPGGGPCRSCGAEDETRFGVCWDCADAGERRAAHRSVLAHLSRAFYNLIGWDTIGARISLAWAWERLTSTGDYAPGGYFDSAYPGFRQALGEP